MEEKKNKDCPFTKDDLRRLNMVELTCPKFENIDSNKLYSILTDKYKNDGTLSVVCYSLKRMFNNIGEENKAKFWETKGAEHTSKNYDKETENKLTGNEKQNWKSQEQILNIMNNIKLTSLVNKKRFLILAMTTHQPPLRKDFYRTLQFIFNEKEIKDNDNYLLLKKPPMKSYYIINHDKVSKWDKFKQDDNKYIELDNQNLNNLLWNSYNEDPRTFVFETQNGEQYTKNDFSKVLLENPFKLNFNILRSSYITNYYNAPENNNMKKKMELAKKMRHSVITQMTNYAKDINET